MANSQVYAEQGPNGVLSGANETSRFEDPDTQWFTSLRGDSHNVEMVRNKNQDRGKCTNIGLEAVNEPKRYTFSTFYAIYKVWTLQPMGIGGRQKLMRSRTTTTTTKVYKTTCMDTNIPDIYQEFASRRIKKFNSQDKT